SGFTLYLSRRFFGRVKVRNQLVALLFLAVFAGLGVLYFQHWVVQKPFGIILIIGEGLAPERIALTRVYVGGADAHLALDGMPHSALVKNHSNDFAVSDQAAAASALATGTKVNNRAVSVDPNGKALTTILELARKSGRATGLVTNGSVTNATCAAFYAHASNANDVDQLAQQLVEGGKIDICMGMSSPEFVPATKQGESQDNRDLMQESRENSSNVARSRSDLETIRRHKCYGHCVRRNRDLRFARERFSVSKRQRNRSPRIKSVGRTMDDVGDRSKRNAVVSRRKNSGDADAGKSGSCEKGTK